MKRAVTGARRCEVLRNPDGLIIYDLKGKCLDPELQEYAFWLLHKEGLEIGTAYARILNLVSFRNFLDEEGVTLPRVSTYMLERFQSSHVMLVMQRCTSKGDENTAQGTVNEKLRCIYKWLIWLQSTGRLPAGTVGPQGRVYCGVSTLDELIERRKGRLKSLVPLFPLVKDRSGKSSQYRSKAVVSREQHGELVSSFMASGQSEYVRRRNALIADIGSEVGFRRDSICSLRVEQFEACAELASQGLLEDSIEIRPPRQKFRYANTFQFPTWLAIEVSAFVRGPRRELLSHLGVAEDPQEAIFVSERSGRALEPQSVTQIFSKCMRDLGRPPGTSVHALRRLFAIEAVEEEINMRVERGLATDTESICRAVAFKMGHFDWKSLVHYVSELKNGIDSRVARREQRCRSELAIAETRRLQAENEQLKATISALKMNSHQ